MFNPPSFFLGASIAATYIFTALTCTGPKINFESCALNVEFQHFIPSRFNKISLLCRVQIWWKEFQLFFSNFDDLFPKKKEYLYRFFFIHFNFSQFGKKKLHPTQKFAVVWVSNYLTRHPPMHHPLESCHDSAVDESQLMGNYRASCSLIMQLVPRNHMAPTVPKSLIVLFFTFKFYLNKLLFFNLKKNHLSRYINLKKNLKFKIKK